MNFRVTTWNINSVRLRLPIVLKLLDMLQPTVLCLQETKTEDQGFPAKALAEAGYPHQLIHGQKSYNGVAIISRRPFDLEQKREWCGVKDRRHIEVGIDGVTLHNFYIPAGGDEPDPDANPKFKHKLDMLAELTAWFGDSAAHPKPAILVGDFNIAPLEHDVWSHKQLLKVVSHTPVEVEALGAWQRAGSFVDAVRHFVPESEKLYSWWSYRARDWSQSDRGRRLDHVWVSPSLTGSLRQASITREARGWEKPSDHAPVTVDFAF